MKREKIAIDKHTLKPRSNNKYFYIKSQKKLFNILNRKEHIKTLNLQNKKKTIVLIK